MLHPPQDLCCMDTDYIDEQITRHIYRVPGVNRHCMSKVSTLEMSDLDNVYCIICIYSLQAVNPPGSSAPINTSFRRNL